MTSRDSGVVAAGAAPAASPSSAEALLDRVWRAGEARIRAGEPYGGLFPSLLDRRTGEMLETLPPPIPGQRTDDRSHLGCNLIHDEALLATLAALGVALGRPEYGEAVDRYLRSWATHCTDTVTGLFPWGEHAYWHLRHGEVGNSYLLVQGREAYPTATHDHLRQAPLWLWERLWAAEPRCVERFAAGLDYHWKDRLEGEPNEYSRHAPIMDHRRPRRNGRSYDFPRHSGFYVFDLAFAHARTGRPEFVDQIRRFADHWWEKRDARGLLQTESRSPQDDPNFHDTNAPGQTLSLAASLYEAAPLLDARAPDRAATLRERAAAYVDGFLAAPHDAERGVFLISSIRSTNEPKDLMPIWGSRYGLWPVAYVALTCLCAYRLTADARLLAWAAAAGRHYLETPFPAGEPAPAMDAGLAVELLADLYDLTGEPGWRDGGLRLAQTLAAVYWGDDAPLPRGAAGIEWYESQMGPSFLLHGLARIALLTQDREHCPLGPDYTAR